MKFTRKIGKKGVILLAILFVISLTAVAVMFSFYSTTTSTHSVGTLFEIKDNSSGSWNTYREMGDNTITFDTTDMVGGDSKEFWFNITLSGDADSGKNLYFYITENLTNGVNLTITRFNYTEITDTESVYFGSGIAHEFRYLVELDEYTPSGTYETKLELKKE